MREKECIAMLLAGGQGSRLRGLTKNLAKPAVPFCGQYRIIDFSLSNCCNSGIDTVGVLTQYKPQLLNTYIGRGEPWDLNKSEGGTVILPPYVGDNGGRWYNGTAHAVYQNMDFIDKFRPKYVLILSGDHIYKMDYSRLMAYHKEKGAEVTIAVIEVPWEETSRFGIMDTNDDNRITNFAEKPLEAASNLASMGVYVFNTETLRYYLQQDAEDIQSQNDFGKNVIPGMLANKVNMYAYRFQGYWRDVGTIESYWAASMDFLDEKPQMNFFDTQWGIYSQNPPQPPHYLGAAARISHSLISEGCLILGEIDHSVIFPGVVVEKGASIKDSVIMSHVRIEAGTRVEKAIIGEKTRVREGSIIGGENQVSAVTVVEDNLELPPNSRVGVIIRMKRPEVAHQESSDKRTESLRTGKRL